MTKSVDECKAEVKAWAESLTRMQASANKVMFGGDGPIINDPVPDDLEDEPVIQVDPKLATLSGQPWFDHAVDQISEAAAVIAEFGLTDVVVFAGAGRLVIGNPVESALAEVGQLPAEGLAFVVLKASDVGALSMRAAHDLSERIRAANPNAHLLVLPEDWSFRTMKPEMAHQFASNMLAFCDDKVLAKIGLRRHQRDITPSFRLASEELIRDLRILAESKELKRKELRVEIESVLKPFAAAYYEFYGD